MIKKIMMHPLLLLIRLLVLLLHAGLGLAYFRLGKQEKNDQSESLFSKLLWVIQN